MRQAASSKLPPSQQAEQAIQEILVCQRQKEPLLLVQSPPGGGKTGIVERVAIQEMVQMLGRVMIATLTNEQAYDIARRLSRHYPHVPIYLFVRSRLLLPPDLSTRSNLMIVRESASLPKGPCIVVANAARWSWADETSYQHFTSLLVDEAYQLAYYRFQQLADLADRLLLVGDPGQIAPVITCETERWRDDRAGPQVACPQALLVRHPHLPVIGLPVSRRLVEDTVRLLQPIFYPMLPFIALSRTDRRNLVTAKPGHTSLDLAIDLAERGASLIQVELPPTPTDDRDEELAELIYSLITTLFARDVHIMDDDGVMVPLQSSMIGVVCTHVSQVSTVVERLPRDSEILVETADRFQGLERALMIVHHPLSGRVECDTFHQGDRIFGIDEDQEYLSWKAHLQVQQALRKRSIRI